MRFLRKSEEPKRPYYLCPDYGTPKSCQVFMFADDPAVRRIEALAVDSDGLFQTKISHYWPQVKKRADAHANLEGSVDADQSKDEHISSCSPCPEPADTTQLDAPFVPSTNKLVASRQASTSSELPIRSKRPGSSGTPADADADIQRHSETSQLAQRQPSGTITPPTYSTIPALSPEASAQSDISDDDISDDDTWNDESFTAHVLQVVRETEIQRGNIKGPRLAFNEPPQTPRSAIWPKEAPQAPANTLPSPLSIPGTVSYGRSVMTMERDGSAAKKQKHYHEGTSFKGTQAEVMAPKPPRTLPGAPSSPTDSEHFSDAAEAQYDSEDERMDIQECNDEKDQSDESGGGQEDQSTCEAPSTPSRGASKAPTTISNGLATPMTSRNNGRRYKNVVTGRIPFGGAGRNSPHSFSSCLEPPPLADTIMGDFTEILCAAGEQVSPDTLGKLRTSVSQRVAPVTEDLAEERKLNRMLITTREDAKFRFMEVWKSM